MTDIPTRRGLGRTRGLLTLLAVLILASAVAAVAYGARQREPQAAAEPGPPAPSATPGPSGSATVSASATAESSATVSRSATARGSAPTRTATKTRPPDSAVQPAVADPAAGLTQVPQQTLDAPPTCGQWRDRLSDEQRLTYAGGQLRAEWQIAGSAGGPPTNTVREFRSAITSACAGGTRADSNVSDVAHAVYVADPGAWGP
jgi:hypothetical protein